MKGFNSIRLFMTDRKSILREVGNTPINIIRTHTPCTRSRVSTPLDSRSKSKRGADRRDYP